MSFTERQQELIDKLKKAGFGWSKFATSVESSGRCSEKQEKTMASMLRRIEIWKARKRTIRRYGWVGSDWDDHNLDAASAGYESNDI